MAAAETCVSLLELHAPGVMSLLPPARQASIGAAGMSHAPDQLVCDECGARAQTIHVLPSGDRPERLALACASHDPGGEWWDLTDLDDLARALQSASTFDELRPGIGEAMRAAHHESATRVVEIPCLVCGTAQRVPAGAAELACETCRATYTFRACSVCGAPNQVGRRPDWKCSFCGAANSVRSTPALSAQARYDELERRGQIDDDSDADVRFVAGFTHVGGTGFPITPGSRCSLTAAKEGIVVTARGMSSATAKVPYSELTAVQIEGGVQTTGGRFIGGGFGLGAAVEGMMVASILNAASRKTKTNTLLRVGSRTGEILLHHGKLAPAQLRLELSPLFVQYEAARRLSGHSAEDASRPDPLAQLERLAKLRDAAAITEEEFQAARAPYVRQLTDGN